MNSDFLPVSKFLEKRILSELKKHLPYSIKAYNMIAFKQMGLFPERTVYFRSLTGVVDPNVFAIENVYLGAIKDDFPKSFAIIGTELKVIETVLRLSKLFDWEEPMLFNGVPDYQLETYCKIASEKKGNIYVANSPLWLYCLQDFSKIEEVTIPDDVEVITLQKMHAPLVHKMWKQNILLDEKHIESVLESGNGVGVIHKQTGELISWFLINGYGSLGLLFTKEEHRGKGYAHICIAALVCQVRAKGSLIICVDIRETNERSKRIFESLGFEPMFPYYAAKYIPDSHKNSPKFEEIVSNLVLLNLKQ